MRTLSCNSRRNYGQYTQEIRVRVWKCWLLPASAWHKTRMRMYGEYAIHYVYRILSCRRTSSVEQHCRITDALEVWRYLRQWWIWRQSCSSKHGCSRGAYEACGELHAVQQHIAAFQRRRWRFGKTVTFEKLSCLGNALHGKRIV
jgi:hypothetical protein